MTEKEIRKSLSGYRGIQSIREIELLRLLDEKDAQIAALERAPTYPQNAAKNYIGLNMTPAQPTAQAVRQHELTVWYGAMPESNGKSNFTAILMRNGSDFTDGITIDRSEYQDRVRYEADRVRYLIGELAERPFILDYDADKHSGYAPAQEPVAAQPQDSPTYLGKQCQQERRDALLPSSRTCDICGLGPCRRAAPPSSIAQQVAATQSEMATWSDERIAGAQLEGGASANPLQELVDQAQALDMGYAPNACPTCGKSASATPVVPEGFSQGVEAAAKWVDQRRFDYEAEHGSIDHDTGTLEFGRGQHAQNKEEYAAELAEIAEGIRANAAAPKESK